MPACIAGWGTTLKGSVRGAPRLEPPSARAPDSHLRFPRLERRRPGCLLGDRLPRQALVREALRRDRAGELLRLPGDSAPRVARGGPDSADLLAFHRLLPRASG